MMASPAITYSSPEGHTPVGSPAPSQILLHRVASPNHLVQHTYVESPRSVPADYQPYSAPAEHFEYEHTPEMYANDDPHIYDFGPNGSLPVDHQFVQPQVPQPDANNLLFMVRNLYSLSDISHPLYKFNPQRLCTDSLQIICSKFNKCNNCNKCNKWIAVL